MTTSSSTPSGPDLDAPSSATEEQRPADTSAPGPDAGTSPTGGASCGEGCEDPHDHAGHDHGPTGSQIVTDLVQGLSILSLLIPGLAVLMVVAALLDTPSTPLPLALGLALGAAQLLVLVLTSVFVARTRKHLAVNPGLTAVRSVTDEVLRLAAVLLAGLLWPGELTGPLGIWVGTGVALVWIVLATVQTVSTRRRIARPSDWSKNAVATFLGERISVRRSMTLRLLDVVGTAAFQLGATVLVFLSPVLAIGTIVLSVATGLATLVLQRRPSAERSRTAWAYAPFGVGLLTLALAFLGLATG